MGLLPGGKLTGTSSKDECNILFGLSPTSAFLVQKGTREENRGSGACPSTATLQCHTISSSPVLCKTLLCFSSPYILKFPICHEIHSPAFSFQTSEVPDWGLLSLTESGPCYSHPQMTGTREEKQSLPYHTWHPWPSKHYSYKAHVRNNWE